MCGYQKVVLKRKTEGTEMGTMVDLGEIASRDPDPKRTKLIFILVERF